MSTEGRARWRYGSERQLKFDDSSILPLPL
jgi:hypothetical protein